ncbi:ATP-binding protein [Candidatus Micrarchaeota archaeon]|nr:ATP-binding protein [Candidatus Micrarchaeota archaeon]
MPYAKFQLVSKKGDDVSLAFQQPSEIKAGDCFKISDSASEIIAQVYDVRYGGLKKAFSEFIQKLNGADSSFAEFLGRNKHAFNETWLAKCKIRGTLSKQGFSAGTLKSPAAGNIIEKISGQQLAQILLSNPRKPASIGTLHGSSAPIEIDLASFQAVTLITGRKGSGKSHLAKNILEHLIQNGAPAIVLDVNGEYARLKQSKQSGFGARIVEFIPGKNFFIPLDGIPFETFCRMCQIEENHNSFRLFSRYWAERPERKNLFHLRSWITESGSPPGTIGAALGRIDYADSLGVFGEFNFGQSLASARAGSALVLNLFQQGEKIKQLSIVYVLRQLIEAGMRGEGKIFLFAEEAQNYFEKEFWDDVITRMRHLGIYSIIITNEPTTLPSMVFRQCDNLFCFNFSSENDLAFVSQAQVIDPQTLFIAKNLGLGQCIAIGKSTNGFPLVIQINPSKGQAGGETVLLWE